MKSIIPFIVVISACSHMDSDKLSTEEKDQIKKEIIDGYLKHIEALKALNYDEAIKFYANVDDHVIFGDGAYWGDYEEIDGIWKNFCTRNNKLVLKWDITEHHVYVFTKNAALYLIQFDNERIQSNGDTTKVTGCFSHGMQRFDDGWKIVTTHVTHNYQEGYDPRKKYSNVNSSGEARK